MPQKSYLFPDARIAARGDQSCDTTKDGFQCSPEISHRWGHWAPYFSVESKKVSNEIPDQCKVTFVQMLSRHGSRSPSKSQDKGFRKSMKKIKGARERKEEASVFDDYEYRLGLESLVPFGEKELIDSGTLFYQRYSSLAAINIPFIRSTDSGRVTESAKRFIEGFQGSKIKDSNADKGQAAPKIDVVMKFEKDFKMTLHHNTCPRFEKTHRGLKFDAITKYAKTWMPAVKKRLGGLIKGAGLRLIDIFQLMELCAFQTVADASKGPGKVSEICNLFTKSEWADFDYTQTLSKYYAYGNGNELGPAQGIGFANELFARLTQTEICEEETSFNPDLEFPVDRVIYLDFTHDNGIVPILTAMGLYQVDLPGDKLQSPEASGDFSAGWVVPFAARAYIEKLDCEDGDFIRVIVNERVIQPTGCGPDELKRCKLDDFLQILSSAKDKWDWQKCSKPLSAKERFAATQRRLATIKFFAS
ncbi:phytase [Penicillium capsulatum]|uniref:Phytase A n=1 Tax=Penicillium capsulatum TaxID=69766 RepID=A0A9W9M016_9EURO|nr:phytase [Penicillium capsulatum]KAJ6129316.1 phytase phyA [Penicillium capsulatum]